MNTSRYFHSRRLLQLYHINLDNRLDVGVVVRPDNRIGDTTRSAVAKSVQLLACVACHGTTQGTNERRWRVGTDGVCMYGDECWTDRGSGRCDRLG